LARWQNSTEEPGAGRPERPQSDDQQRADIAALTAQIVSGQSLQTR